MIIDDENRFFILGHTTTTVPQTTTSPSISGRSIFLFFSAKRTTDNLEKCTQKTSNAYPLVEI